MNQSNQFSDAVELGDTFSSKKTSTVGMEIYLNYGNARLNRSGEDNDDDDDD